MEGRARSDQGCLADWLLSQKTRRSRRTSIEIEAQVKSEIDAAVAFAFAGPYPATDQVEEDVYA